MTTQTPNCDLHTHTLYSDGALPPEALVDLAASRGVTALAVTDHDTLAGLPAATQRGRERGLEVVPGIELSVQVGELDVHLLGYFVTRGEVLRAALDEIQHERVRRADLMVERLAGLGMRLDAGDVARRARGGVVGRPHVAEALLERGFVSSLDDAFDRFLAVGRPAFVPKRTVTLREGAALLRAAGGVPVVAHPSVSGIDALVPELYAAGVLGLEVWHPTHNADDVRRYSRWARRHGLVPTGGSDFHRESPGGLLPGGMNLPIGVLDALRPLAS
jgi:hypothetical protein